LTGSHPFTINGRDYPASGRPHVLGVVNLSPESPNQDSVAAGTQAALRRAEFLAEEGAEIIDVGAQSSFFEAPLLPEDEELTRLVPVIQALKARGFTVSADTLRPSVAAAAIAAGADLINDSDGFQDPEMIETLARWGGPLVIPFISGASPHDPLPFNFDDPMADIAPFLSSALARAHAAGLKDILLDPGTGYRYPNVSPAAKEQYQLKVYRALPELSALGAPLLVALPRKESMQRTLELVRMIAEHADFVRAHDPAVLAAAISAR
jgi:dihydropteroate synthase